MSKGYMPQRKKATRYVPGAAKLQVSGYEKAERARSGDYDEGTKYLLPARKIKSGEFKGIHETLRYTHENLEKGAEMNAKKKNVLDLRGKK